VTQTVGYPNVQSAATGVHRWLREHGVAREVVARPWNRYDPVNSPWYLVPSPDWPAFQRAKGQFQTFDGGRTLYCGSYIEQGLECRDAGYPARSLLADDWDWHRFTRELSTGAVGRAAAEVSERTGCVVRVCLGAGYASVPEPGKALFGASPWDMLWFTLAGGDLVPDPATGDLRHLGSLGCRQQLASLPGAVASVEGIAWLWVDAYLGVELEMVPLTPGRSQPVGAWGARDLWERTLEPWYLLWR